MKSLLKAFALLTHRERAQFGPIIVLAGVMAFFEVAGIASVLPFLSIVSKPELIDTNPFLSWIYGFFGFSTVDRFLFFLGFGAFGVLITAAVVRTIGQYTLTKFAQMQRHTIGVRLLNLYLRQPYEFYLNRHSGDLANGILAEIDQLIAQIFQPFLNAVAQGFMLIAIVTLLLLVNPWIALSAGGILGGAYGVTFFLTSAYIERIGKIRLRANKARFEIIGEIFGGIKSLKIGQREHYYIERFWQPSYDMSRYITINHILSLVPKYIIEAIAFGGIIALSMVLVLDQRKDEADALGILPLLGLYAFAGYRILPAIQSIYQTATQFRFGKASVDTLYEDLCGGEKLPELSKCSPSPLRMKNHIRLESLCYAYPNSDRIGLCDITVDIPVGSTLGIVGLSGAGKTTLVDLILGLLKPSAGKILVDDTPINSRNLRSWQSNIGYVPQDIFLIDASIEANIAIGINEDEISQKRVRECAKLAQICQFIEEELPQAFATKVGERGVCLSGGQRQRIGIARALYHDPEVLIFDEATNALDHKTEQDVVRSVEALARTKTLIIIAHKLSIVEGCDQILVLDKGGKAGLGTYTELATENQIFRKVAGSEAVAN